LLDLLFALTSQRPDPTHRRDRHAVDGYPELIKVPYLLESGVDVSSSFARPSAGSWLPKFNSKSLRTP
jgi:hypothetical protein